MQRILTEEEYQSLLNQIDAAKTANNLLVQSLCTQIADLKPVKYWGREEASIWGCIHTSKHEHYCDECPVNEVCPEPHKYWSK